MAAFRVFRPGSFVPPRREYELELRYVAPVPPRPSSRRGVSPSLLREKFRPPAEAPPELAGLIRSTAEKYGFSPGLIAAIVARESGFNPRAAAPDGGRGLMQLMPEVMVEQNCSDPFDPAANLRAGCAHLAALRERFSPELAPRDRIAFALAAYNGGLGHVLDARALAPELKLDPDRWSGEVEEALLFLKYKSYYSRFRHGFCRADLIVDYVSGVLNSAGFQ